MISHRSLKILVIKLIFITELTNRGFQIKNIMNDVLPLKVIATIRMLEFLFIASSQNGSLVIRIKILSL